MRRLGALSARILPLVILSAWAALSPADARSFPNQISLGAGLAHFGPDEDGVADGSVLWQGSFRYDRFFRDAFFVGAMADAAISYCPVCDQRPRDDLRTLSLVGGARYPLGPLRAQFGAGIGYAKVEDERLIEGRAGTGKFSTLDIPLLSRLAFEQVFGSFGLGIGLEAKYHWNFENDALSLSMPLTVSF